MVYGQGEVSSNLDLLLDNMDFLVGINGNKKLYDCNKG
jgi:hypothetical protein